MSENERFKSREKTNPPKRPNRTNKTKKKKKGGLILRKILKVIFILFLLGVLILAGLFIGLVFSIQNGAGALSKEDFEINNFTTYVYDMNGKEYTTLTGKENRTYASLSDVSPYFPKAFIAIEDERFESHKGVDIKRTLGATAKYILSKFGIGESSYGGSTITQQVIKKVTGEDDKSPLRKAKEIIRAIQLETWLSKDQIIELYMNLIYLGEGAYGVEAAAYTYFNKSADELTIAECALIAGLAQLPEGYNPYNYPDRAKTKQGLVLGKMLELEYITQEQYDEAINQELVYSKGSVELASSNSYFVDAVVEEVIEDLMDEKGVTRTMAQKMVYNNGLHIYTTINPEIQDILDEVYLDENYFKTRSGYDPELQSAMVIIDYAKGNVVALVGGAGEKTTLRGLNRATQMTRSPGSNMKPIGVYGPGLEKGVLTAATTFDDVPTTYRLGATVWTIKNYDGRYRGLINIRKAIEISDNIVAAKALQEKVTTEYSYQFLKDLGITTMNASDRNSPASLSLGGMSKGVTPLELAAAYGTIANNGVYVEPKLYTQVKDRNGEIVLEKQSEVRDVMSKENAYILTDMLKTVTTGSEGTARLAQINGIDVAAKTGTTSDDKDRWFTAYTPYYVGAVWFGYDQPKYIDVASNPGTRVWKAVMAKVHENLPSARFIKPDGVVSVEVCRDSGLIATDACKHDRRGNRTTYELFNSKNGTIPTETCNVHEYVAVCPDSYKLANPTCLRTVGTVQIVCLNRHYEDGQPTIKPWDYEYEIPTTYCEYHECLKDESGNWIISDWPLTPDDDDDTDNQFGSGSSDDDTNNTDNSSGNSSNNGSSSGSNSNSSNGSNGGSNSNSSHGSNGSSSSNSSDDDDPSEHTNSFWWQ